MKNDFQPVIGHRFDLSANWGVVACRVTEVEPNQKLAYTWEALGLESVVTWTLTPSSNGTLLRMEQIGFGRIKGAGLSGRQVRMAALPASMGSSFWRDWTEFGRHRISRHFRIALRVAQHEPTGSDTHHRWLSLAFTVTVIANFAVRGFGEPPAWVTFSPLPPLFLLMFSGLLYVRAALCRKVA